MTSSKTSPDLSKTERVYEDLRRRIRELALPRGLVDVKVCAVDAVWSGLKLVRRVELRGGTAKKP